MQRSFRLLKKAMWCRCCKLTAITKAILHVVALKIDLVMYFIDNF